MLTFLLFSLFILCFCLNYTVRKNHLFCPAYPNSSDLLIYQAGRPHAPSSLKWVHAPCMCLTLWLNYLPKAPILTREQAWGLAEGQRLSMSPPYTALYTMRRYSGEHTLRSGESLTLACVRFTLPVSTCHHSAAPSSQMQSPSSCWV